MARKKRVVKIEDNPSKRMFQRAIKRGVRSAAQETMEVMGYNIIARNGWIVKVFRDGTSQNVKKIQAVKRRLILD